MGRYLWGLSLLWVTSAAWGQALPDATLPVPSQVRSTELQTAIEGGTRAGANLFHSFSAFSVPAGQRFTFAADGSLQNILARVTGNLPSQMDGTLAVAGAARLFLINPNGIRFGEQAQLDIAGALVATTAARVVLADGSAFGVGETPPLLSLAVPVGVQFGAQAAPIEARGPGTLRQNRPLVANDDLGEPTNLGRALTAGRLHWIGGNLVLDGALLQGNTVALVAGGPQTQVDLADIPTVQGEQGTLTLQNQAVVYTPGGTLSAQGRQLQFLDGSRLESRVGAQNGGPMVVRAQDTLTLQGGDRYLGGMVAISGFREPGNVGPMTVEAARVELQGGAAIVTDTFGLGKAGAIAVTATEKLHGQDGGRISSSAPQAFGQGNNIRLRGQTIHLQDGFQVAAIARGANAIGAVSPGNITVEAQTVQIEGVAPGTNFPSGLFTSTLSGSMANAGNIEVVTDRLSLRNGGQIDSRAGSFGIGSAGSIEIWAREQIDIEGTAAGDIPSALFVIVERFSFGNAGRLLLTTPRLQVRNGAEISVSSNTNFTSASGVIPDTVGAAGNLTIRAGDIAVTGGSTLRAETVVGNRGNLEIFGERLLLRDGGQILTNAGTAATGGNVRIETQTLTLLDNSTITANAVRGRGGNIQITAQGIFAAPTTIIAASSALGIDGTVTFNTPNVDPGAGLVILPLTTIDLEDLLSQGCDRSGGRLAVVGRGGLPRSAGAAPLPDWGEPTRKSSPPILSRQSSRFGCP